MITVWHNLSNQFLVEIHQLLSSWEKVENVLHYLQFPDTEITICTVFFNDIDSQYLTESELLQKFRTVSRKTP